MCHVCCFSRYVYDCFFNAWQGPVVFVLGTGGVLHVFSCLQDAKDKARLVLRYQSAFAFCGCCQRERPATPTVWSRAVWVFRVLSYPMKPKKTKEESPSSPSLGPVALSIGKQACHVVGMGGFGFGSEQVSR